MKLDKQTFKLDDTGGVNSLAIFTGFIGAAVCVFGCWKFHDQFFYAYLTSYIFWVTIGLGGLFFTLLHHLVDATWSVVLRRMTESVMVTLPIMLVFFIPVYLGMHELYHWSHIDVVAHDELLQHKSAWLNPKLFSIRTLIYFVIWFSFGHFLYKLSIKQDTEDDPEQKLKERMRQISGPGMLLFALTITFAAYDWLMSLDPHWYSTIFGVYIFAGSLLSILSFITLLVVLLRKNNVLNDTISIEHFHDLGKLIFAFTVFWAYIAFSQYFLIWYGNIPEETIWYLHRWEGGWNKISLFIVLGHFVIPFFVLLSREPKRNVTVMTIMSFWMLFIHWVDLYWIILPNFNHHFHFSLTELVLNIAAFLGIGGLFFAYFWFKFTSQSIIPLKDPRLKDSIKFVNM